jgi:hypothetical protein
MADLLKANNSTEGNTPWRPTYKWMGITSGIIFVFLIIAFFVLNIVLKPYMRELPHEITPWLKAKQESKAEQPQQTQQDEQNAGN